MSAGEQRRCTEGERALEKTLAHVLLSDAAFDGIDRYGVRDMNPTEQMKAAGHREGTLAKPVFWCCCF